MGLLDNLNQNAKELEVLNNTLSELGIDMKTRVNLEQIKSLSRTLYLELAVMQQSKVCDIEHQCPNCQLKFKDPQTYTNFKYSADECFKMTMEYIKKLKVSIDSKENRVDKVIDGLKSMNINKNEGMQAKSPFQN